MPNKLQILFIKEALDSEHLLSEYESEFINKIAEYDNDKPLTEKQNAVLNRISQKIKQGEI